MGSLWGSPVLHDGVIYVGSYDRHLYAIDAESGALRWRFETSNHVDTTPAVHDGTVYFGGFDKRIYAVNAEDGEEEWRYETDGYVRSSPVVHDGTVYIGGNCKALECAWNHPETPREQGDVFALDASSGEELWDYQTDYGITSSPSIHGGTLYIGSSDRTLYALDADTGHDIWTFDTEHMVISTPTVQNGMVYVGDWAGNVYGIGTDGREGWLVETDSLYISGSLAVCNGIVYIGAAGVPRLVSRNGQEIEVRRGKVFALDAVSGAEAWSTFTEVEEIGSTPAVADDVVYIGGHSLSDDLDGGLYAFDADSGEIMWSRPIPGVGVGGSPVVANDMLYVGIVEDLVSGRLEAFVA